MKLAVFPWNPLLGKDKVFPGSLIDDEDLARVRVGLFAKVEVIKVGRILVIEEKAEVAMPREVCVVWIRAVRTKEPTILSLSRAMLCGLRKGGRYRETPRSS